jgi:hypothetical protein
MAGSMYEAVPLPVQMTVQTGVHTSLRRFGWGLLVNGARVER